MPAYAMGHEQGYDVGYYDANETYLFECLRRNL